MYKKHKIPKKIVDKIKQRNKLNKEIEKWCNENLDMDGMCSLYADITRSKFGDEQGVEEIEAKVYKDAVCVGCGYLKDNICTYKGSACGVSKPMLESIKKVFEEIRKGGV